MKAVPGFVFCFSVVFISSGAFGNSTQVHPPVELGKCIPTFTDSASEESLAKIEAQRAELKNVEVLARLIFSEALSSGYWNSRCEADSSKELMESIGWGILNRVKTSRSKQPYFDVVFKKQQFRTSFSGRGRNSFAVFFLCPLKADDYLRFAKKKLPASDLYQQAEEIARQIVAQFEASGIPPRFQGIQNFFYPKSEFFGELRPSWAKNPVPEKNRGYLNLLRSKNPCVEFYR